MRKTLISILFVFILSGYSYSQVTSEAGGAGAI